MRLNNYPKTRRKYREAVAKDTVPIALVLIPVFIVLALVTGLREVEFTVGLFSGLAGVVAASWGIARSSLRADLERERNEELTKIVILCLKESAPQDLPRTNEARLAWLRHTLLVSNEHCSGLYQWDYEELVDCLLVEIGRQSLAA
jgi:hypothetical protein